MEFTTNSGATAIINVADFISSMKLKRAVVEAVKSSGADLSKIDLGGGESDKAGSTVADKEKANKAKMETANLLINIAMSVDSDERVYDALFKCLLRCTYDGVRITRDTFEAAETREDYYEVAIACMKVNLAPFFKPLFSKFNELAEKILPKKSQKSQ